MPGPLGTIFPVLVTFNVDAGMLMDRNERQHEITAILATGYLRLQAQSSALDNHDHDTANKSDHLASNCLDTSSLRRDVCDVATTHSAERA